MTGPPRCFVNAACAAVFLAPSLYAAQSEKPITYPTRPVRFIVPYAPGAGTDTTARTIAAKLSERWGQQVVVDNRAGGGGHIGIETTAYANPDGYTIGLLTASHATAEASGQKLSYDITKDLRPITQAISVFYVVYVPPSMPVKSIKDLIAMAKSQPGKLVFASSATGSASHLSGARFNYNAGIKVVHVAFKGGPDATIEVLAGRAQYHVGTMGVVLPFVKEGKLVALAVTTPQRSPVLPDVPALSETLSEFRQSETSHAILVPAGTPRTIVNQLNKEIHRILELPDVKERLQTISFIVTPSTPDDCRKIVRAQLETLSKLVADAGLRPK
jgi:tripartite-type tricarboxylate transporter receptor subunit TctC